MRPVMTMLATGLLAACATTGETDAEDRVRDFIVVSDLSERDRIRTMPQWGYDALGDRYLILESGKEKYLVEFRRRCRELRETHVVPDIRHQHNVLRARFDTIRGCAIEHLYAIDDAQAEELQQLVGASGQEE